VGEIKGNSAKVVIYFEVVVMGLKFRCRLGEVSAVVQSLSITNLGPCILCYDAASLAAFFFFEGISTGAERYLSRAYAKKLMILKPVLGRESATNSFLEA